MTATLSRHDPRAERIFNDHLRAVPQIIAADTVAGEMDYVITAVARDVAELQEVLAGLSTRGGQRLVTYLRLAEVKPPSRLPLAATIPPADQPPRGAAGRPRAKGMAVTTRPARAPDSHPRPWRGYGEAPPGAGAGTGSAAGGGGARCWPAGGG